MLQPVSVLKAALHSYLVADAGKREGLARLVARGLRCSSVTGPGQLPRPALPTHDNPSPDPPVSLHRPLAHKVVSALALGALMLTVNVGCNSKREAEPEQLCEALVEVLQDQVKRSKSLGMALDPMMAMEKCMEQQTKYKREDPKEYAQMAGCAIQAKTVNGWRMCGYPRRRSS